MVLPRHCTLYSLLDTVLVFAVGKGTIEFLWERQSNPSVAPQWSFARATAKFLIHISEEYQYSNATKTCLHLRDIRTGEIVKSHDFPEHILFLNLKSFGRNRNVRVIVTDKVVLYHFSVWEDPKQEHHYEPVIFAFLTLDLGTLEVKEARWSRDSYDGRNPHVDFATAAQPYSPIIVLADGRVALVSSRRGSESAEELSLLNITLPDPNIVLDSRRMLGCEANGGQFCEVSPGVCLYQTSIYKNGTCATAFKTISWRSEAALPRAIQAWFDSISRNGDGWRASGSN